MVYIQINRGGGTVGQPDINGIVNIKWGEKESLCFGFRDDCVLSIRADSFEAKKIIRHFYGRDMIGGNIDGCTIPIHNGDVQYWYGDIAKTIFSSCFIIIDEQLLWKIK